MKGFQGWWTFCTVQRMDQLCSWTCNNGVILCGIITYLHNCAGMLMSCTTKQLHRLLSCFQSNYRKLTQCVYISQKAVCLDIHYRLTCYPYHHCFNPAHIVLHVHLSHCAVFNAISDVDLRMTSVLISGWSVCWSQDDQCMWTVSNSFHANFMLLPRGKHMTNTPHASCAHVPRNTYNNINSQHSVLIMIERRIFDQCNDGHTSLSSLNSFSQTHS